MLSVICPIYNEEKYIGACIESILAQDYPKDDLEVIFADGMSTDRTREIVAGYTARYPWIRLIDNPDRIVPPALNAAIRASKGDIIMRLDAHAEYPTNYFTALTHALKGLKADNVGAVCLTLPTNDTPTARAIAAVLSSRFGMGNSAFRVGAKTVTQDDEFNGRLTKAGGKIYLLPEIEVKYFARDKVSKVARMFYQYGLFKPLVNKKLGSPATLRQFVPLLLVAGLVVGAVISLIWHPFVWVYIAGISLYLLMALLFSLRSRRDWRQVLIQMATYVTVHISYGCGYLVGLWKLLTHKSFNANNNR